MAGSHTGEALAECIYNTLTSFKIAEKISSITTDNGANIVKACIILKDDYSLIFNRIPCFADLLNLVVQNSLNNLGFGKKKATTQTIDSDSENASTNDQFNANFQNATVLEEFEINENSEFMSKCRKLVGLFNYSTLFHEQLIEDLVLSSDSNQTQLIADPESDKIMDLVKGL